MKFRYKIIDNNNALSSGEIVASSKEDAEKILRRQGMKIVQIHPAFSLKRIQRILPTDRLALLFSQMELMSAGGLDIATVLTLLEKRSKGYEKRVIKHLLESIQNGKLISEAAGASGAFPHFVPGMLKSGESAGELSTVFKQLSVFFKEEHAMKQKLLNALAYPVLLIITSVIVLNIVLQAVLPIFTEVFTEDHALLPWSTRLLIALSEHLSYYGYLYIAFIAVIVLLLIFLKNTKATKKKIERLLYLIPVLRPFYRDPFELRFLRTMKMQIDNGVDMLQVFENAIVAEKESYIGDRLSFIKKSLFRGETLADAMLSSGLFHEAHCHYIALGEEASALSDMLRVAIEMEDYRQKNRAERIAVYIEPVLIILMALVVGFIIFSIAIPMFDMVNHF